MREAHRRTGDERRRRSRSGGRHRHRRRSRSRSRSRSSRQSRRRNSRSRSRSRSPRRRSRSRSRRRSRSPRRRRRRPSTTRSRSPHHARHHRFRSESPRSPAHRRFRSPSGSPARKEQPMASIGDHVKTAAGHDASGDAGDHMPAAQHHGRSRGRRGGKGPKVSLPKNWTDVPKMGGVVGPSRFVPIRVPLDGKYAHHFQRDPAQQWSPRLFLEEQAARGLDVRLVIDLTNTFKYYDGVAEFHGSGVEYVKLKIEGFHAPPHDRDVARFTEIVDAFTARESAGTIAVHCTHGLNRTGYLVVTYMVQRLGCSVTEALAAFSDARPPGLIKHMYVEDLYRRLGRDGEEVQLPTLPDWAEEKYAKRGRHH